MFWVSLVTPAAKGTVFQELVFLREQRGALLPLLLLRSSLCPFLGSVKGKQDCLRIKKEKTYCRLYQSCNRTKRTFLAHCYFHCSFEYMELQQEQAYNLTLSENQRKENLQHGFIERWRLQIKWDALYNCAEKAILKITMTVPESDPVLGWLF